MITAMIMGFDRRGGKTFWIVYQEELRSGIIRNHRGFLDLESAHEFFMELSTPGV